jgi:acylphosphatase
MTENGDESLLELHAVVTGRVQGVGFRAAVRHQAKEQGITGIVRNLDDASVEIIAQGDRLHLEAWLSELPKNTWPARIQHIDQNFRKIHTPFTDFNIVH